MTCRTLNARCFTAGSRRRELGALLHLPTRRQRPMIRVRVDATLRQARKERRQRYPTCVVLTSSDGHGKVAIMKDSAFAALASAGSHSHELRFASLFDPGRGISFPCDASGKVDPASLTERLRVAYFGARAMVGRDYAFPKVQRVH